MAVYIARNFSLSCLSVKKESLIRVKEIQPEEIPEDVKSAIEQPDIANIVSNVLGFSIRCNRSTIWMNEDDVLYVVQYEGARRLPKGVTYLPEGLKLTFLQVTIHTKE